VTPLKPGTPGAPSLPARERAHALIERCEAWTHPDPKHDPDEEGYACFCCIAAEFEAVDQSGHLRGVEEMRRLCKDHPMQAAAYARGRREALEEAAADFKRLHREGCEIVEEGRDRARPEEEIESDALRAEVWGDAADILSALAREEGE
jgi:hypothetical protein